MNEPAMIYSTNAIEGAVAVHRAFHRSDHFNRIIDQCVEEMAELTKELLKSRRCRDGRDEDATRERIASEMADVLICLEFIGRHLSIDATNMRTRVSAIASRLDMNLSPLLSHTQKLSTCDNP